MVKKKAYLRKCSRLVNPALILLLIVLLAYVFFILEVSHNIWALDHKKGSHVKYSIDSITVGDYINWACFGVLLVLTCWSLVRMVFSVPGYVPLNYRYDENKLSAHDAVIYQFLSERMHTTV